MQETATGVAALRRAHPASDLCGLPLRPALDIGRLGALQKALSALRHRSREELHEQGPAAIETNRELIDLVASCGHSADKKSIVSGSP